MGDGVRVCNTRVVRDEDLDGLLEQTRDPDPEVRRRAVRDLCPCEVKFNSPRAWTRLTEMVDDPDVNVRRNVFHVLIDGSPRDRQDDVVAALERMRDDPHQKLRRKVRGVLARQRREGRVNFG